MKKIIKNRFTLAEVLVSMAVFSILLVLMMQFFSGARTLWTANEKRASIYADASVAMDLISMLLQSTFYDEKNGTIFAIRYAPSSESASRPAEGWNSKLYFASKSMMKLSEGGQVRYLCIQRGVHLPDYKTLTETPTAPNTLSKITQSPQKQQTPDNNVLQLRVFSDTSSKNRPNRYFSECFFPFGLTVAPNGTLQEARNYLLQTFWEIDTTNNNDHQSRYLEDKEIKPILHNVTSLKFTPVDLNGKKIYGTTHDYPPAGIEVELSLMDTEATVRQWWPAGSAAPDNAIREKNEYTFRRIVWLGDRIYRK